MKKTLSSKLIRCQLFRKMKPTMLLLIPVSLIISHQPELHQYTKDRTLGFSPSKNDNYKNEEENDQKNPIITRISPYFTKKRAITNFQSQVNPINPPSCDSLGTSNHLLQNLFDRIKCDYKREEELALELRRNPGSDLRFFGLKANVFFGLLSALRGPPGPPDPPGPTGDVGVPATSACITCPPGPTGPTGSTGPTGPSGMDGAAGANGVDGAAGIPGANGVDGASGADGIPGANGVNGVPGADGIPGANGVAGVPGADGIPGANGVDGVPGAPGLNGIDGANGLVGPTGPPGPESSCCSAASSATRRRPRIVIDHEEKEQDEIQIDDYLQTIN